MNRKKKKRNNSNQLKLSGCMDNPKKEKKSKLEDKKAEDKIPNNPSYKENDMSVPASFNRIKNFENDLFRHKKIEFKGEYEVQKLRESAKVLLRHIKNFQKLIEDTDFHYIDTGPNVEPFFYFILTENEDEKKAIQIDDIDKLPNFDNIFDDFKDCEKIDENIKENIKIKKDLNK